ncbi:hypothetical protein BC834DRAFT_844192 [Gloeopeniophorella convolvens]|nr:hypothetical protein BC834DRAFT_844192 [Gloeopeniophorella convolvens]
MRFAFIAALIVFPATALAAACGQQLSLEKPVHTYCVERGLHCYSDQDCCEPFICQNNGYGGSLLRSAREAEKAPTCIVTFPTHVRDAKPTAVPDPGRKIPAYREAQEERMTMKMEDHNTRRGRVGVFRVLNDAWEAIQQEPATGIPSIRRP